MRRFSPGIPLLTLLLTLSAVTALLPSCSTTRCLSEGEQRLVKNTIVVENDKKFPVSELTSYLKQKTPSWNPMLYVYNWQDGKGKGWDKFVKKAGTAPLVYDSLQMVNSCTNIGNHLEYLGYYNSTVTSSTAAKRSNPRKIEVTYNVHLGKRYPIKDISFVLPDQKEFQDEFYADTACLTIHKGDCLAESSLEAESVRSSAKFRDSGYYGFSKNYYIFEADTVSSPDSALLKYTIRNYTRNETEKSAVTFRKYTIGRVELFQDEDLRFREKLFKDFNILRTGELYNESKVNTEYARYSTVGLFSSVNIQMTPRDSVPVVDCTIHPQKGKLQGFKFGLEASFTTTGLFSISPQLSYYHRNIFHGGEVLNASIKSDHQFSFTDANKKSNEVAVSLSLLIPRFIPFSPKLTLGSAIPKTEVKLSYDYQSRPEYQRHIISASYGYTGVLKKLKMRYQFSPLSASMVWLPYMTEEFRKSIEHDKYMSNAYSDHSDVGANFDVYFSNFNYQTGLKDSHGWYVRLQYDLSGNILSIFNSVMKKNSQGQSLFFNSPYAQYVRFDINAGRTWNWSSDEFYHSLALHLQAGLGYAYGNSITLPFEKQFYAGGANSLRGWTAKSVGPGTSKLDTFWTIPNQTGDMKLEFNIEYRFKIFWKIAGAVFVDAGNIWCLPGKDKDESSIFKFETLGESTAASWGVGLRGDLTFLILRFDMGLRFHDPALDGNKWLGPAQWFQGSNYAFQFGVGYPF